MPPALRLCRGPHQTPPYLIFEIIGGALRLLAKHLDMRRSYHRVSEVVDHARRHHLHVIAFAGIDEQVRLDHGHVTEETVHILRGDQADLTRLD